MDVERPGVDAAAFPNGTIAIVGAGQAGGWAAYTLRQEGYAGRIVLIGQEAHAPHERPPLSKAVLAGEATPDSAALFKPEAFAALGLDWRAGIWVTSIDATGKRLTLSDGGRFSYDKLILCTGGRARALATAGADTADVRTLRTIDDALALAPMLKAGRKLVVIGGGWIGLEVAATARTKGVDVTVVEAQSRLCERSVPRDMSEHLLALHRSHGTRVILGAQLVRMWRSAEGLPVVELADGQALECDTIVAGVGLVPNDNLAREAGLACDGGVLVDAGCRTSDPSIYAAGDVAVSFNPWAGRHIRLESWQNAQDQGMAAARSALGQQVDYQPLPWFWSDQYGMNLQIYGIPLPSHRVVARGTPGTDGFLLFYLERDVVQAAIGINAAKDLRFGRRLIEQRRPVDLQRLADIGTPMAKV
ncbi:pyridine nucleotide-disulfide oxidoreductase [Pelomonas sp. HMWF004]|nr:pyridine nucleotide-disulfide oxidoreductase [Pelomonas sp. HMWF004]